MMSGSKRVCNKWTPKGPCKLPMNHGFAHDGIHGIDSAFYAEERELEARLNEENEEDRMDTQHNQSTRRVYVPHDVGEQERLAWDLLPDDVKRAMKTFNHKSRYANDALNVLASFAQRAAPPPPWEPTGAAVEVTARAITKGLPVLDRDRAEARRILRTQHEAGLFLSESDDR